MEVAARAPCGFEAALPSPHSPGGTGVHGLCGPSATPGLCRARDFEIARPSPGPAWDGPGPIGPGPIGRAIERPHNQERDEGKPSPLVLFGLDCTPYANCREGR